MDATLLSKYNHLEEQLLVLKDQYHKLAEDHRELRTRYARLSVDMIRQREKTSQVTQSQQIQDYMDQYDVLNSVNSTTSSTRLHEVIHSVTRNEATHGFNWITPNMAIGDIESDYAPFDIVVDLSFVGELLALGNTLKHHDIRTTTQCTNSTSKQVTEVAIYDHPGEKEFMKKTLNSIVPLLVERVRQLPNLKILFHCFAGISRSGSLGIAFIALAESLTYDAALKKVQEQRPRVNPNPGFVEAVKEFLSEQQQMQQVKNMVIV